MSAPHIEPVAVAVLIATWLVGPRLAETIGAYSIIFIAWFFGAMANVLWQEQRTRRDLALFFVVTFGVTIGMTVPAAQLIVKLSPQWLPGVEPLSVNALLFPVAFAMPAWWQKWPQGAAWLWSRLPFKRGQQ